MPRRSRSMTAIIGSWKVCLAGHKANAADFPYLATDLAGFEQNIKALEAENAIQEKLKAQLAAQTLKMGKLEGTGERTHSSLMGHAVAKYGRRSPKMKEFRATGEDLIIRRKKPKTTA